MIRNKFNVDLDSASLQMLLNRVSHLYFAKNYEQISEKGMHPGQVPMLRLLAKEGGLSQREIAQKLHVKPPTVAVSIKRMENAGFLEKSPDLKDQRITRISLSPMGRGMIEDIKSIIEKNEEVVFKGFTESEQCLLRRFLIQIIRNLEEMKEC